MHKRTKRRDRGLEAALKAAERQMPKGYRGSAIAALAHLIGHTRQAVSAWRRVPGDWVIAVETVTGVPRHALRPDLHPPLAKRPSPRAIPF
jgi:hypothetical protein